MRVLIIDDDFFITTALKTILESDSGIQVCGSGKNGKEAVTLYDSLRPDILLMDIRMEEMDGLAASAEILALDPQAKILLLTTFLDDEYIIRALKLGARGYLLKQDYNSIIPALKAVYSGQTVYGNEITAKPSSPDRAEKFSLGNLPHRSQRAGSHCPGRPGHEQQRDCPKPVPERRNGAKLPEHDPGQAQPSRPYPAGCFLSEK